MTLAILGISVLWVFLLGYVIVASIDFGAGFFNAYSLWRGKHQIISKIIRRYLSPVWEITNVFLVFFFVGIVGFFPDAAKYYGTVLLIPASIALVLLAIRGSYYAFESYGTLNGNKWYALAYGVSGLLIPASLSVVLTISEGGFIKETGTGIVLDYVALFTSPLSWAIVVLSVVSVLYISSVFLTWYSNFAGDLPARELMRKYALIWAAPMFISALGIIYELRRTESWHFENMLKFWWLFALSAIVFFVSVWLLYQRKRFGLALILLFVQFALAFFAYGISHYPYLLHPYLSIEESVTSQAMGISLVIVFIFGLALLIPSLYLVFKFFILDKRYASGEEETHI